MAFNTEEFIEDVKAMRLAQKAYFMYRNAADLTNSKKLESVVDEKVHNYTTGTEQGNLF